jgi:hypothetical protein
MSNAPQIAEVAALVGLKWIEQARDSRALAITPAGRRGLVEAFGLSL